MWSPGSITSETKERRRYLPGCVAGRNRILNVATPRLQSASALRLASQALAAFLRSAGDGSGLVVHLAERALRRIDTGAATILPVYEGLHLSELL